MCASKHTADSLLCSCLRAYPITDVSTSIRSLEHAEKEKERLVDEVEEKEIRNTELLIGASNTLPRYCVPKS